MRAATLFWASERCRSREVSSTKASTLTSETTAATPTASFTPSERNAGVSRWPASLAGIFAVVTGEGARGLRARHELHDRGRLDRSLVDQPTFCATGSRSRWST